MGEFSGQDVGEDFKVTVRMRGEAASSVHTVFVQHPQSAELCESRVVPFGGGVSMIKSSEIGETWKCWTYSLQN